MFVLFLKDLGVFILEALFSYMFAIFISTPHDHERILFKDVKVPNLFSGSIDFRRKPGYINILGLFYHYFIVIPLILVIPSYIIVYVINFETANLIRNKWFRTSVTLMILLFLISGAEGILSLIVSEIKKRRL